MSYTKITQKQSYILSDERYISSDTGQWVIKPTEHFLVGVGVSPQVVFVNESSNGDKTSPTPYTFSKETRSDISGEWTQITDWGTLVRSHTRFGPYWSVNSQPWVPNDSYNRALSDLFEQMRGSLDLSVSVGEHASTRKMFTAASKLSRYLLQIHPKHWANHWLEYKYGWSPLVSDLYGAVAEVNRRIPQLQTFKSSKRDVSKSKTFYLMEEEKWKRWIDVEQSTRTKFVVLMNPSTSTLSTLARFSSLNPASIAWELTPFSFVFDWFIDIGSYVRDLETSLMYSGSFRSGYTTETGKQSVKEKITGVGFLGNGISTHGSGDGAVETRYLSRRVLSSLPMPRVPRFNPRLGASRLITAAALLKTVFLPNDDRVTPPKRRITQAKIQQQLQNFKRGPKKAFLHPLE